MKIAKSHDNLGMGLVVKVGGKGDRKGNKVWIKDLDRGCSEIRRRAASSKVEVKHIVCLVTWMGLGKSEVKRVNEVKERVGRKLIKGRRREVEVTKYEEHCSTIIQHHSTLQVHN